jgi:hypothetical protein
MKIVGQYSNNSNGDQDQHQGGNPSRPGFALRKFIAANGAHIVVVLDLHRTGWAFFVGHFFSFSEQYRKLKNE